MLNYTFISMAEAVNKLQLRLPHIRPLSIFDKYWVIFDQWTRFINYSKEFAVLLYVGIVSAVVYSMTRIGMEMGRER